MRCLLDVMMAVDEMMRFLMFPVPFHPPFPFALPLSPALPDLLASTYSPALRVGGGAG